MSKYSDLLKLKKGKILRATWGYDMTINDPKGEDGWLIGSYPLTDQTDSDCSHKHRGVWGEWEGRANGENHAD